MLGHLEMWDNVELTHEWYIQDTNVLFGDGQVMLQIIYPRKPRSTTAQ